MRDYKVVVVVKSQIAINQSTATAMGMEWTINSDSTDPVLSAAAASERSRILVHPQTSVIGR